MALHEIFVFLIKIKHFIAADDVGYSLDRRVGHLNPTICSGLS